MSTPDQRLLRNLAFWGANIKFCKDTNIPTTGFGYEPPEQTRLFELGARVADRFMTFMAVNSVIFIVLAAIAVGAIFIPIMSYLYPDPSKTPAVVFLAGLALTAAVSIGFGLPLSMSLSAALCAPSGAFAGETPTAFDRALAAKVSYQTWRMTLIMCGLLVPGAMFLIVFNIDAGPLVTILKIVNALWFGAALVTLYLQGKKKREAG